MKQCRAQEQKETWQRAVVAYWALPEDVRHRIAARFVLADQIADDIENGQLSPFFA